MCPDYLIETPGGKFNVLDQFTFFVNAEHMSSLVAIRLKT